MRHTLAAAFLVVVIAAPSSAQLTQAVVLPSDDATIYSESGSAANGAGENLFAGKNSGGALRRMLTRYDVAAAVPAGSIVVYATAVFFVNQGGTGREALRAHRVLSSWSAGPSNPPGAEGQGTAAGAGDVTWTMREFGASLPWITPGGDFALESSMEGFLPPADTSSEISSPRGTSDVQSWLDHPALNFGWCWIGNEVTAGSAKRLGAIEAQNPLWRPPLVLEYFAPGAHATLGCYPISPNSVGAGATSSWSGSSSIAVNDFTLYAAAMPPGTSGMFFFGRDLDGQHPFGDGLLCVPKPHFRLGVQTVGANGAVTRALDLSAYPGNAIQPMSTWTFQFYYRDTAFGGAGFNTSNAVLAPFIP